MVEYLCCSSGGMVDTLVSGTSGLCRVGSNPISSTILVINCWVSGSFFILI